MGPPAPTPGNEKPEGPDLNTAPAVPPTELPFVCLPVSWVVLAVRAPMMTAKIKVAIFESSEAKKV